MPSEEKSGGSSWTVLNILRWTTDYFKQHALDTPRIDAEILLSHVLQCQRIDLYLRHDQPLNEQELAGFKQLIKRRVNREPVAYIVGAKEFWSLPFDVGPGVLIPRPDTECLVQAALGLLPVDNRFPPAKVLELGVGSGAIIVALAHERPACHYWATDASWPAIQVARKNAGRNGVQGHIFFVLADWLQPISPERAGFDLVVANPPYIPSTDIAGLAADIREFEPIGALDGGADGLRAIRAIIGEAYKYLNPKGQLLLEMGYDQGPAVRQIAERVGAYDSAVFHRDLGGHDRVVQLAQRQGVK